ncbi:hypothetical protein [Legionella sp.]|uniref:hypothetical protein n=1 Tax=Legionella sp. TaxID=459 RepID=UPI00257CB7AB|nr:hypothetical protein [Legionella sp.]
MYLSEHKLKDLESGKLEIKLTQSVGIDAGGAAGIRGREPNTPTAMRRETKRP